MPERKLYAVKTPNGQTYIGEHSPENTDEDNILLRSVVIRNTQEIRQAQLPDETYESAAKKAWEQHQRTGVGVSAELSSKINEVLPLFNID